MDNKLYIFNDVIVDQSHHVAYMKLLKVLFRLEVIDESTTVDLALEFRPFFV